MFASIKLSVFGVQMFANFHFVFLFQLQGCKAKSLEFLSEFIEKVGKKILPYAVDIKVRELILIC